MGKIRSKGIKKQSIFIFRSFFKEVESPSSFEEIKNDFGERGLIFGSKKLRNRVAGYLRRILVRTDSYKSKYFQ